MTKTLTIDAAFSQLDRLHRAYERAKNRADKMPRETERERLDRSCAFIRARMKYENKILRLSAQLARATR